MNCEKRNDLRSYFCCTTLVVKSQSDRIKTQNNVQPLSLAFWNVAVSKHIRDIAYFLLYSFVLYTKKMSY